MSYFLTDQKLTKNQSFRLEGEEANHLLKSRRVLPGEKIEIQDIEHKRFLANVEEVAKRYLILRPTSEIKTPKKSPIDIHLYQALVKEKAIDFIVQKGTELGVTSITFFHSVFSQRLKKDQEKLIGRWKKIAWEACKQSGRVSPPEIFFHSKNDLQGLFGGGNNSQNVSICLDTTGDTKNLASFKSNPKSINLLIGPEGGWQEEELDAIKIEKVHFGPRILRADTAAIAAISALQFLFGDLKSKFEA